MRRLVVQGKDDLSIIASLREIHGRIMLNKSEGISSAGATWRVGDEGTLHVVQVLDESVVVLNGEIVYNDGSAGWRDGDPEWSVDKVAEAIGQQLGLKVIHIDASEIAERNIDEWIWHDVIKEAIKQ